MYSSEDPEYRGVAVLSNGGATSFRAVKNNDYIGFKPVVMHHVKVFKVNDAVITGNIGL